MNTHPPLAAALLLMASAAIAQPLASAPTPNGGLFAGGVYNPGADPAGAFGAIQGIQPDVKWARADCQRIPCKTALQQRMEDQKKLTPNDLIVDMGDGESFGIISTDDKGKKTISIDNGMSCGMPRALTDAEQSKFAAQIAKGDTQKADAAQMDKSINRDNTQTGAATPPTPSGASDNTPSSGYQDGANMMTGLGGDSSGGDSSGGSGMAGGDAGGTSGGAAGAIGSGGTASAAGSAADGKKAIPFKGKSIDEIAITHTALFPHQKNIDNITKAYKGDQLEDLHSTDAPVAGRLATPPTSAEQGKMQFGANGPAPADGK